MPFITLGIVCFAQQGVHVSVLKMPRSGASVPPVSEVDGRGMGDGAHNLPSAPVDENSEPVRF